MTEMWLSVRDTPVFAWAGLWRRSAVLFLRKISAIELTDSFASTLDLGLSVQPKIVYTGFSK